MTKAFQCGEILIGAFDHYIKSGLVNANQIANRELPKKIPKISKLINDASIPSFLGGNYTLDENGDLLMDFSINIYKYNVSYSGSTYQPFQPVININLFNFYLRIS
jgi:hypothetical protein